MGQDIFSAPLYFLWNFYGFLSGMQRIFTDSLVLPNYNVVKYIDNWQKKGKPGENQGRKATGLDGGRMPSMIAGLPARMQNKYLPAGDTTCGILFPGGEIVKTINTDWNLPINYFGLTSVWEVS